MKPDQETYFIQAAILGNFAFIELYIKKKGVITITDPQNRTGTFYFLIILALHHSVANGHRDVTSLLCTFGKNLGLLETEDLNGCTPLFHAIRYNELDCLKILVSFECNLLHRMYFHP